LEAEVVMVSWVLWSLFGLVVIGGICHAIDSWRAVSAEVEREERLLKFYFGDD
jgi:hypothetical protein